MVSLILNLLLKKRGTNTNNRNLYGYVCGACGIFLNLLLFSVKLVCGLISRSVSVIADAFNNFSDAATNIIGLLGFSLSAKKPDKEHPFGHGRTEYICGTLISVMIVFVGGELLISSVESAITGEGIIQNKYTYLILLFSLAVKFYMYLYNRKYGNKISSSILLAVAKDSLFDCFITSTVIISNFVCHLTSLNIDPYVGAVVSVVIIIAGIKAIFSSLGDLLGKAPSAELISDVINIVSSSPATVGVHDIVVHEYGKNKIFVSLHMEVDGRGNIYCLHDAVDLVEKQISKELGCEAVIHMDPIDVSNPDLSKLSLLLKECAARFSRDIVVHDIRIVPGPSHTNVIFDVAIPPDHFHLKEKIELALGSAVTDYNRDFYSVINSELSYR